MAGDKQGAIGYLQKKNRFYGWSKQVFLLDQHGLSQLSTDKQSRDAKHEPTESRPSMPRRVVIGDVRGINLKHIHLMKHKQLLRLSDIAYVSEQGSRELAITSPSGILVLRALAEADQGLWVDAIRNAASASPQAEDPPIVPDEADDARSQLQVPQVAVEADSSLPVLELPASPDPAKVCAADGPDVDGASSSNAAALNSTIGWLPSLTNIVEPASSELPIGMAARLSPDNPDAAFPTSEVPATLKGTTKAKTDYPKSHHSLASDTRSGKGRAEKVCLDMIAESFDADGFFDENDTDNAPAPSFPQLAAGRSALPLAEQVETGPTRPVPSRNAPALALHSPGQASTAKRTFSDATSFMALDTSGPAQASNSEFGDIFGGFMDSFSTTPLGSTRAEPEPANSNLHDTFAPAESALRANSVPKVPEDDGNNSDDNDETQLGVMALDRQPEEADSTKNPLPATAKDTFSGDIGASSIVDLTSSLVGNLCLFDFSASASSAQADKCAAANETASHSILDDKPLLQVAAEASGRNAEGQLPRVAPAQLDPPGQHNLGERSMYKLKTVASSGGLAASSRCHLDDPQGIQPSLLAKYSDSLNSSRALLSSVGQVGRPKTMQGWQANVSTANVQRGMDRPAEIVQYEPAQPKNNGVNKVVRGQLAKDFIKKETERKPAVRRVRRAKSETKVPPLKAIRLKLDGSVVGSRVAGADVSQAGSSRGLRYMVKDGRIEGPASQGHASQGAADNHSDGSGHSSNPIGEFDEIKRRLKAAEDQKKHQQQARLLDKDASDGMRIADIIEGRQDIPLAVQLEERRRMQYAKQQAVLNQQLEQQRMQLEVQRLNMEQQQQYEQFKRQSLCPDVRASRRFSVASHTYSGWQEFGAGEPGGDSYTDQWVQSQDACRAGPPSTASASIYQHPGQCSSIYYQQPSRPTTPMAMHDGGMSWMQQQQQYQQPQQPSRPNSYYPQANLQAPHSAEATPRTVSRSRSNNPRRQAGGAFIKQTKPPARGTVSEGSNASTESWQSQVAHSTKTSIYARTEPTYEGSVYVVSPTLSASVAKRSSSIGYTDSRRSSISKHGPPSAYTIGDGAPPVPPVPRSFAYGSGGHGGPMQYGPPAHMPPSYGYPQHASYDQWVPPPRMTSPGAGWNAPPMQPPPGHQHAGHNSLQMHKRCTEMSAKAPSLLQQLNQAQVSGIMPGWSAEKPLYRKGAYQNASIPTNVKEGSGAHYLGDGNSLLIDRVYESEKTKRAFLRKVSRNYTGVGGEAAPPPMFTH
ncbi:hypothetical protein GGF46_000215 [Coemansia sp. RSA 552]|nr:hypothetical protein GGF46_000215 [Coemansia sp. RSA 552]